MSDRAQTRPGMTVGPLLLPPSLSHPYLLSSPCNPDFSRIAGLLRVE